MSETPTPLALFLAEHDVPCPNPKCGFNLRGLKDATCPECKEPLSLCIAPRERLSFAPILVAVSFAGLVIAFAARMNISEAMARSIQAGPSDWWSNLAWAWRGRVSVPVGVCLGLTIAIVAYARKNNRRKVRTIAVLASSLAVTVIVVSAWLTQDAFIVMNDFGIAFW